MTKRILFLVNPVAHRAKPKNIRQFCQYLQQLGAAVTLVQTKNEAEAIRLSRQATQASYDIIAVAGGDGTIAGVASGLYAAKKAGKSPLPLWIVPLGTANVLARELHIPCNLKKNALYLMQKARKHNLWPGIVKTKEDEKIFLQMASSGLDAETVAHVSYKIKKYLGPLAYIIALIKLLSKPLSRIDVHLHQHGNKKIFQASCAIFSRGSLYGGPFCIAKKQNPQTRNSTLILFQSPQKITFFLSILGALLPFSFLKKHLLLKQISPEDECYFEGKGALQADGDLKGTLPVQMKIASFPIVFLA